MEIPANSWGVQTLRSSHYFPQFLWKFLLSNIGPKWIGGHRIHVYDVVDDGLVEARRIPHQKSVFCDFDNGHLDLECLTALDQAEKAFARLEDAAETALTKILRKLTVAPGEVPKRQTITLERHDEEALRRYLIFLRYRNSDHYHETIARLGASGGKYTWVTWIPMGPLRRRAVLRSIKAFLEHDSRRETPMQAGFIGDIDEHCWRLFRTKDAEISVGIASEDQEFIFTDRAFGNLHEVDPDGSCDGSYHLFFPITPTVSIYLMIETPSLNEIRSTVSKGKFFMVIDQDLKRKRDEAEDDLKSAKNVKRIKIVQEPLSQEKIPQSSEICTMLPNLDFNDCFSDSESTVVTESDIQAPPSEKSSTNPPPVVLSCDVESVPDVHLRNAMLLRDTPRYLLFSSLLSMTTAITVYDPARSDAEHTDLSALKLHCRQKHIREGLRKTLVVRDTVMVTDLTEEVALSGQSAVGHGSFADIWMGEWVDHAGGTRTAVALKVLRQCMTDNIKEKLLKRLKSEVLTWHRLRHPHIIQLYGIVQLPHTLAMVSPWCKNGTIVEYLKDVNPTANRLRLLAQIASGVAYLHNCKPVVIHGDLKGNNILIDDGGMAVIADFGMAKVLEDFESDTLAASVFGGATRWLAPEIVKALMEDDGGPPPYTMQTDVYAFASVCLEIATGKLPYSHRTNAYAVGLDKLRGVKPCREDPVQLYGMDSRFWTMLERCWDEWYLRPSMSELTLFLGGLI